MQPYINLQLTYTDTDISVKIKNRLMTSPMPVLILVLNHPQKITDFHEVSGLFSDTDIYSGETLLNFIKSIF